MSGIATDTAARLDPPVQVAPLTPDGDQHSQAWTEHNQAIVDRLAALSNIGQYLDVAVLSGAAVTVPNNTTVDAATLALPEGDWEVSGECWFTLTGTATTLQAGLSSTAAALPGIGAGSRAIEAFQHLSGTHNLRLAGTRIQSPAAGLTAHLAAFVTLSSGTAAAYGRIMARRFG